MLKKWILALTILSLVSGCKTVETSLKTASPNQTTGEKEIKINKVSLKPKQLNLLKKESVTLTFNLNQAGKVELKIYDEEENLIYNQQQDCNIGLNKFTWAGKNKQQQNVPNNVYIYKLTAENKAGQTFTYDLSESSGGKNIKIENLYIDQKTGEIKYLLPQAGRVRMRMGLKEGGPLLLTYMDWEPRTAGEHLENWDGKDKSQNIQLLNHPDFFVITYAYSLPENSIIVTGGEPKQYALKLINKTKPAEYLHAGHDRSICHEPELNIEFPKAEKQDGMPILKAVAPLIIKIDPKDLAHLNNSRYEIVFFVDGKYLFEDEEGYTPFTYLLNTKNIPDGEHLVTANIVSHDDHIGVITKKIIIKNQ